MSISQTRFDKTLLSIFGIFAIALALLLGFPAMAHAQDAADDPYGDKLAFSQVLVASVDDIRLGEPFTLNVVLTSDNNEAYQMYAYSSTIRVNTNQFDIGEVSARSKVDYYISPQSGALEGWSDIVFNFRSTSLAGATWQAQETTAAIELTPKATGEASVLVARLNVSNHTGMSSRSSSTSGFSAQVLGPRPPCVACDTPFTSASGLVLVTYEGPLQEGFVPCYKETPFVKKNGSYVALVDPVDYKTAVEDDVTLIEDKALDASSPDVNGNGYLNIVDAQIAYDLAIGGYTDFSKLALDRWIAADVNGSGNVDASDALAIQYLVLAG